MKKQTSSGKTFLAVLVVFFLAFVTPLQGVFASTTNEYYEDTATKQHFSYDGTVYEFTLLYDVNFPNLPKDEQKVATPEGIHVSNYTSDDELDCVKDLIQSQNYSMEAIQIIADLVVEKQISNLSEIIQQLNLGEDVGIVDLIIATNNYYSNPINFLYEGDKYMELNNFIDILEYNQEKGISDFIVRYENKVPVEPPVTTGTTQTEVTTTWTEVTTTTPVTTTVETTEATTIPVTTTVETTEATTIPVTTTVQTTETTTIPVTTTVETTETTTMPVTTTVETTETTTTPVTTTVETTETTTTPVTTTEATTTSTGTTTEPTKPTNPDDFVPPAYYDLISPTGAYIGEKEYQYLIEGAENFGISKYEIKYNGDRKYVEDAIIVPDDFFSGSWMIAGAFKYIETSKLSEVLDYKEVEKELGTEEFEFLLSWLEESHHVLWRPIDEEYLEQIYDGDTYGLILQNTLIVKACSVPALIFPKWILLPIE